MKQSIIAALVAILALLAAPSSAAVLDFEDLVPGTSFNSGDNFITSGVIITAQDFTFANGTSFGGGVAEVDISGLSGGSGHDLGVNNILLDFAVGNLSALSLDFGEFGGNLNVRINGIFQNFEDFSDIDGLSFGGALVSVTNGAGNDQGALSLTGPISSFAVGGQEL